MLVYKSFVSVTQFGLYIATGAKDDDLFIGAEIVKIFLSIMQQFSPDHGCSS